MTALKWIFVALITIHGLIHLFGFVKAFGLAEMSQLTQPISRSLGILWLMAALALIVAAVSLAASPQIFWMVGLAAMVVSQIVIVTSWSDAKFGTVANVIVLLAVAHGFATFGPLSLRAAYERGVEARLSDAASSRSPVLVTEEDLAPLPEPLQAYVQLSSSRRVCSQGEGRWHPSTGEFTYLELALIELHVNETSSLGGLSSEPRRT